jgi:hypothetical protein
MGNRVSQCLGAYGALSAAAGGTFGESGLFCSDIVPPLRGNGTAAVLAVIEPTVIAPVRTALVQAVNFPFAYSGNRNRVLSLELSQLSHKLLPFYHK